MYGPSRAFKLRMWHENGVQKPQHRLNWCIFVTFRRFSNTKRGYKRRSGHTWGGERTFFDLLCSLDKISDTTGFPNVPQTWYYVQVLVLNFPNLQQFLKSVEIPSNAIRLKIQTIYEIRSFHNIFTAKPIHWYIVFCLNVEKNCARPSAKTRRTQTEPLGMWYLYMIFYGQKFCFFEILFFSMFLRRFSIWVLLATPEFLLEFRVAEIKNLTKNMKKNKISKNQNFWP